MSEDQQVSAKEQELLFGDSDSDKIDDNQEEASTAGADRSALSDSDWASQQDWQKLQQGFLTTGFREGIDSGKEESVQNGFNDGFRHGVHRGFMKGKILALLRMEKLKLERQGFEAGDIDPIHEQLRKVNIRTGLKYQALEEQESVADQLAEARGQSTIRTDNAGEDITVVEDLTQFKNEMGSVITSLCNINGGQSSDKGRESLLLELLDKNCPVIFPADDSHE